MKKIHRIGRAVVKAFSLFAFTMAFLSRSSTPLGRRGRQLRFFDPDHRTCGKDPIAHIFARNVLYGAKSTDEGYYMRRTISTIQQIPDDKDKVNHILQVLSYISLKLHRPIRINKRVISGYNSEDRQAYSLVHAANLHAFGIEIVENNYWQRASVAQATLKLASNITLESDPLGIISKLKDANETHEYVFDIDELLAVDTHVVGNATGQAGGYKDGTWLTNFACMEVHPNPIAIPRANDPLSK